MFVPAQTRQLLRGSPLLRLADSIAAAAAASWEELAPLIARGRAEGLVPAHVSLSKVRMRGGCAGALVEWRSGGWRHMGVVWREPLNSSVRVMPRQHPTARPYFLPNS